MENRNFPFILEASENISLENFYTYLNKNKKNIIQKLYKYGALLFRGFPLVSLNNFEQAVKIITPDLKTYEGGDSPREKLSKTIYTSTSFPSTEFISLHNEKSFSNNYPHFIYFFCQTPPLSGGETPILDGRVLYQSLDPRLIKSFKDKKLKYVMNLHSGSGLGKSWQETFETENCTELEKKFSLLNLKYSWLNSGSLRIEEIVSPILEHPITKELVFFSQADQWHSSNIDSETLSAMREIISEDEFYHNCYYGDGSEIEIPYLEAIRNIAKQKMVTFSWQKGDLLMLDNIIALHGRNPYKGERRILVAMA